METCEFCKNEFVNVKYHQAMFCSVLTYKPKKPCKGGCMGYHVHEMLDGQWAIFFDDMPQITVSTEEEALRELPYVTSAREEA